MKMRKYGFQMYIICIFGLMFVSNAFAQNVYSTTDFGTVQTGKWSDRSLGWYDEGGHTISGIAVVGPNASDFVITADTGTGGPHPKGWTGYTTVRFLPTAPGRRNATLIFNANIAGQQPGYLPLTGTAKAPAVYYTITDLGLLPKGNSTYVYGINDKGHSVGTSATSGYAGFHAVFYKGEVLKDIGTLGGSESYADDINEKDHIAGSSLTSGDQCRHAFYTSTGALDSSLCDLDTFGGTVSQVNRMNDSDQVVGYAFTQGNTSYHAFLHTGYGKLSAADDLGTLGGTNSNAAGINNNGYVVGGSDMTGNRAFHAFVWKPNIPNGKSGTMFDLGSLGGTSLAGSINMSGQVIGWSYLTGNTIQHAFSHSGMGPLVASDDLGTLGGSNSRALGINDEGLIVGTANTLKNSSWHAFLYNSNGLQDINGLVPPNSAWELQTAWKINNAGQIVGSGVFNGQPHGFILTPNPRVVLLVHGIFSNASDAWYVNDSSGKHRKELLLKLDPQYTTDEVNFPTEPETLSNEAHIEQQAQALARKIREMRDRTGQKWLSLICHSMGGLAARYYLHHTELWQDDGYGGVTSGVVKLIMMGTPNWGTDIELQNPIIGVAVARLAGLKTNVDTHVLWSPAFTDIYAEWQVAPTLDERGYPYYPDEKNFFDFFLLSKWKGQYGVYDSPIDPFTFTIAGLAKTVLIFRGSGDDQKALDNAQSAFDLSPLKPRRKLVKDHIAYYPSAAASLGIFLQSLPGSPMTGVNGRRVSRFLYNLNVASTDESVTQQFIIAGTQNKIKWIPDDLIPFLADPTIANQSLSGPFWSIKSDGLVPVDSVMGINPISKEQLFPQLNGIAYVDTNHTDLPNFPAAVDKVLEWLHQ